MYCLGVVGNGDRHSDLHRGISGASRHEDGNNTVGISIAQRSKSGLALYLALFLLGGGVTFFSRR